jgi:6-phosphogluconolactonase
MDPSILIFNTPLIFDTPQEAAEACGDRILEILDQARRDRGMATLAVSGGSTPRLMFQAMAKRSFDWSAVDLYQVDERLVPADSELSNFRMIRESLLSVVAIEESRIHHIRGELKPEEAARIYVDDIRRTFHLSPGELPAFDVLQRGMGADAHTASLFPGEPLITDRTGIAAVVNAGKAGGAPEAQLRITLLPGVLECARHTFCLTTGGEKAEALRRVLRGPLDPLQVPSQIALQNLEWYIDKSAGARL